MQENKEMIFYNGKWIPKQHFRIFMYSMDGQKKVCNNYQEYKQMSATGLWFDEPINPQKVKPRKKKDS